MSPRTAARRGISPERAGDRRVIANRLNTMPRWVLGWSSGRDVYDHAALIAWNSPLIAQEHAS